MQKKLIANSGMILTDGEIFGKVIFLGNTRSADDFYEISKTEYDAIMAEKDEPI